MGRKSETAKSKRKGTKPAKEKINAKMLAIAIIFVMLFVSFAVIITTQDASPDSKNMVFFQDNDIKGTYTGNVRGVNIDLASVKMIIRDDSSDISNSTTNLVDGTILTTKGNFSCTYYDKNENGKLDSNDEFFVENADEGDWIRITLKTSDTKLAFYRFSKPF
jgi:hypothetical protein